ncbi:ClC family H(+)/Cl(-) exchange transporter [Peptostreptococcus russellii]|uniref:H+/Cl-antiporter ClcA n=1 Tax=Peptostreptococcus russellii TaxID=215200 RepID=A0A1H8HNX7_9FIRM|nr:ClC family H(+)/Cl(-) exchange transporter [Peptostreptococcus russellii]SEN57911.1 H+/Cl-antiporter ClcA [Peptostreptococcus russellii]
MNKKNIFSWLKNDKDENVLNILGTTDGLKYKMIGYSLIVGILSGATIVLYRILGEFLLKRFEVIYRFVSGKPLYVIGVFVLLILMSLFVTYCVKKEPNISGSGIPQVEGIITRRIETDWKKVLIYKFVGGIMCLAAGLSVGREGPSVQMGAAIGEGISKKANQMDYEHKYLITSGASAGLAAAFNAPLAGVMFALEEVHKNFSPIVLMSAMVSAVTADVITKAFLGINPSLRFAMLNKMPIKYYWSLVILGILVGLSSYVFNNGILKTKHLYRDLPIKKEFKIMIPFVCSGIVGMTLPVLVGGGHSLIMSMESLHISIFMMLLLFVIKYLFTFISFGSGVPGGIFFPLLAIGSIIGAIFGMICIRYLGVPAEYLINFAILAMAGHFAAIVKAPITGIILIFEMTGSFEQLLPLSVVVFIALLTSDLLGVNPVYDDLLEDILSQSHEEYKGKENKKTLVELVVHLGSDIEGKYISEVEWPQNCLVVSIYRGEKEIIPRGNTRILEGDLLLIMVNQTESSRMLDYFSGMISCTSKKLGKEKVKS